MAGAEKKQEETLRTLPGDDIRQIMWRYSERYDLQMMVQSTRQVARGPVARLVADGGRNSHEWTPGKNALLKAYDESGLTGAFMSPEHGGMLEGPKNLAMALVAWELAWVDGGSATASLANNLALAPIHERGTKEQVDRYMSLSVPPKPGEDRKTWRGAFALTEALPYVGVETGILNGTVKVAEWKEGQEPVLLVEKRGRFITNSDYANFVTAAVDTADERIKTSCMIILEETDPGTFDRGAATRKMVHQLSSTRDPIFSLKVPASRIIGGYTIQDGKIVPHFSHGDVIEAVFKRTRITVGLMTTAKLISAIEPVIRYHRQRFRGAAQSTPGTPRYDLGIQTKEDALQRLVDVWAMGEGGASLGFACARLFDELDPMEPVKERLLKEKGVVGARAQMRHMAGIEKLALEAVALEESGRDPKRLAELLKDELVRYIMTDSVASVLCPATKLWNTGWGATTMRETVALMGGYGITEDCPGFLGSKWFDSQLEATYEGPEAVQRRQLSVTQTHPVFLAHFARWAREMEELAKSHPRMGSCVLAKAMKAWSWTLEYLQSHQDADGAKLYQTNRHGVTFTMADSLGWLLASYHLMKDVLELEEKGPSNPNLAEGIQGTLNFYYDLAHVLAARAAGESSRLLAELVYGFQKDCACDGASDAGKAPFAELRSSIDRCLAGSRLAKDRAGYALSQVMIPEALDYPV